MTTDGCAGVAMPGVQVKKAVLVLEPDPSVARVLEIAMRHAGFGVEQVTRSSDAVARLEEGQVACVLIDLNKMNGDARPVLDWLHEHGEKPPWLVLSSMDAAEAVQTDTSIQERFLAKPFDPWTLIERVKDMTSEEAGG